MTTDRCAASQLAIVAAFAVCVRQQKVSYVSKLPKSLLVVVCARLPSHAMSHADRSLRCFAACDCRGVRRMCPTTKSLLCEQAPKEPSCCRPRMAHCYAQKTAPQAWILRSILEAPLPHHFMPFISELSFVYTTSADTENQDLSVESKLSVPLSVP